MELDKALQLAVIVAWEDLMQGQPGTLSTSGIPA